ncbi:DUF2957 domain-containing protein [Trinickia caryophylli]|uniref:DUF2957 domain-containing protein n=1 Tax=Trinickia caryophylli TaxID=28094 RepID=A0A1X7FKG9_TRICW|nr:DUF2957 domain-containing protein [Trinickia caryophylli]PMS13146.1 DUF2957 domain-containing protein [Trinickia caryophylli]TRX19328.1 DUF2957 domain-containing protein [Trinickia caryophylli]WQE13370.1 DUF2957 domain-containing protein [Trinickia caryophylli]SMF53809.1 Protein of unknown function [Trinickia caryophylli]GLU34114.1 lipoprotein [Trinickia caryophylli]
MTWKALLALALAAPIVTACGGSGGNSPAAVVERLCPASLDYNTVFTGGGGDGELVKMQIDTTKMTWRVSYVESPVPRTTGTATPTRAGTTQEGTLTAETKLPTTKQNQCTYYLNGASLDSSRPARIFVGEGVLGGTIPGKEIQYNGMAGVGAIADTTFPYYPFIGFSSLETDLTKVAGVYNQLGYHQVPSQNFLPVAVDSVITINANGTWTECDNTGVNAGKCQQPGTNWAQSSDGSGAFETDNFQGQATATLAATPQAKGFMIVGKLRNQLVPILIRTGYANPALLVADDESGISILAPQTAIANGSQNGQYIGVDSEFNYRATALIGTQATLLDPYQPSQASLATALDLDYAQSVPGVVRSTKVGASSPSGKLVFTGGVFGYLDQSNASSPYFTINAFVQ